MLRDETKARLRRLTRKKFRRHTADVDGRGQGSIDLRGKPKHRKYCPSISPGLQSGREVINSGGKYLLLRRSLGELWPGFATVASRWQAETPFDWNSGKPKSRYQARVAERTTAQYAGFRAAFPRQCLFLDLETCGFAGSMIFLAGVVHELDGELTLSQLWARNYAEEKSLLCALRGITHRHTHLVTFNGKSFDWPQVRDRCVLHERRPDGGLPELTHIDLLHLARRRWKSQLPDCKLQTLEKFICGRFRSGDVAGQDIPEVYQHYVRTGDETRVGSILHHNALDLVTLLELSLKIGTAAGPNRTTVRR